MEAVVVRFDSLRDGAENRSLLFGDLVRQIEARSIDEVCEAIVAVEQAVAEGFHCAGYISYEAATAFDPALATRPPDSRWPLVWFGVFRRRQDVHPLAGIRDDASQYELSPLEPSIDRASYEARVRSILELIASGDTYQVNFTFRLRGTFVGDDLPLYRDLCRSQRAAFCAYLRMGSRSILSASPELFFRRTGDVIEMRPMKGTRRRGRWNEEDDALLRSLAESPKDRAENLMIVDLLRNDLGRVAEYGSVRVPRAFEIERYPTVHQLTSTITARAREDVGLLELLRAVFPSGSVTGAPKVRTSEIIRDLEDSPRGPYTGAIGFVSPDESIFSVAIRTLCRTGDTVEVGIGSGITADSDPGQEYEECLGKGAFVRRAWPEFELLETMRLEPTDEYPLIELHLERIARSAAYFGYPFDSEAARTALQRVAGEAPGGLRKARLRVARDGTPRVSIEPVPARFPPSRLALASFPVDETDPFLYHKTTHRAWIAAAGGVPSGVDDVIFWNSRGELTETTIANLVLDLDGELVTPPVQSGLLAGTMRRRLIEEGALRTRVLTVADLHRASRILLTNAVRGCWEGTLVE